MMFNMNWDMNMGWGMHLVMWPLMAALVIVPLWRICQRLGQPGMLSLLAAIPLVNLGLLYYLAFNEQPVSKE